ncbi:MAG: MoxR-like ATPase [Halieaceae bacterium]|jgi:MoxR-like ATPase
MSDALDAVNGLREAVKRSVVGQSEVIDKIVVCLLCNGHVLLEGLPGTAKTRAVKSLARTLEAELGRIQFTPDLLPSDVTGTEVYHADGGHEKLTFERGPIFANLVLGDEINRAPAKVQSALLEAMEERQVTVAGNSYPLPELFMVLATQNPIEQEGTYPLPEAQMDRFMMKLVVDYPGEVAELDIIRLVRSEETPTSSNVERVDPAHILTARKAVHEQHVSENLERYIVALVIATREPERYPDSPLASWIEVGSSPRASINLDRASRAWSWLQGKDFVDPDDVRAVVHEVLGHRLILSYEAVAEGVTPGEVVRELVKQVAVA